MTENPFQAFYNAVMRQSREDKYGGMFTKVHTTLRLSDARKAERALKEMEDGQ